MTIKDHSVLIEDSLMQHKFIELLKQSLGDAKPLNKALAAFSAPKELTVENFKAGIQRFIWLANMSPEERVVFYGNRYAGVYNNNHFAELWNTTCQSKDIFSPHDLDDYTPRNWELITSALKYTGATPATALNELLRGPTVIDCGIFCQLGIWFGILNILGEERFNTAFGRKPFWITTHNFVGSDEDTEGPRNSLFSFFTNATHDSVSIEYVYNDIADLLKHPGGTSSGENCLILDSQYHIFTPLNPSNGLTRSEVVQRLLDSFNAPPDFNDAEVIKLYYDYSDFFEDRFGSIYELEFSAIVWFKLLQNNRIFLEAYADLLDAIHECRQKMTELFGDQIQDNGKISFIASFSAKDLSVNRKKHEDFFAMPPVNETFEQLLADDSDLFEEYYHDILKIFTQSHIDCAELTLSLADYTERRRLDYRVTRDIPTFIHFNLDKFLIDLRESELDLSSSSDQKIKRLKVRDSSPSVIGHNLSFFPEALATNVSTADGHEESMDTASTEVALALP